MKQLLLLFTFLMGTCLSTWGENMKLVQSAGDSTRMDTVVVSTLQDSDDDSDESGMTSVTASHFYDDDDDWEVSKNTVGLVAIIICCGLPFFVVSLALWFRYKNRQAKYKLAAEALAAGQSIPQELFKDPKAQNDQTLSKGIKNIFLGIGLGVFLWTLTGNGGLAAIGFLIFCMGLGQVLIAYATAPRPSHNTDPNPRMKQDEDGSRSIKAGPVEITRNDKTGEKYIKISHTDTSNDEKE